MEKHPIMGNHRVTAEQMIDFVKKINPSFNSLIAHSFLKMSPKYGVRGDVAFCQSILETNWFRYGGDVKADQNNFAGLGATGGVPGARFATIDAGVTAQIQHLYAYATVQPLPSGEPLIDPRFHLVNRGSAPNWEDLTGKWAVPGYERTKYPNLQQAIQAGATYGQQIINLYERMLQQTAPAPQPPAPPKRDFTPYSIDEFQQYMATLPPLERQITHIQIHHTWEPRKTDYVGESTIYAMWKYHTQTRGWDDIGQHFTVSPDGLIWDGRSLEQSPAGIEGHNKGGLMIEIIGNFDVGEEKLEGKQLESVLQTVRILMRKFNLTIHDIVFHREYADKTCPGTGIPKDWFLQQVQNVKDDYPDGTPLWKKEAVDWMYEMGLLSHPQWKQKIDQPLPLWAKAIVLQRLMEKK